MNFDEVINNRYSVRKYDSRTIEEDKLNRVLNVAALAPTGVNSQPFKLYVTSDIEKIAKATPFSFGAPTFIIICTKRADAWTRDIDNKNIADIDASIVTTHLMLKATDEGLGTCIVGKFDPRVISSIFDIEDGFEPLLLLPIGYPANDSEPSPRHSISKSFDELIAFI